MRVPGGATVNLRPLGFFVVTSVAWSCGGADARPQWTVTIATDAPVPQFGDRLLVEVLDGGGIACAGCRRELGVADASQWPVSFGITPPAQGSTHVRVRLYRAAITGGDGLPAGSALIDALGFLPPPSGVTPLVIVLAMDCFGIPSDPIGHTTCDPTTKAPSAEPTLQAPGAIATPSSWSPAQPVPCASDVPNGMKCIPGGVFLLGDNRASVAAPSLPERLVQLSPFALDADELTVGAFRALVARHPLSSRPVSHNPDPLQRNAGCTYIADSDTSNDALPLNCVSFSLATDVCTALGKRLPTEAEWEFAAGNTTDESAFAWGSDDDICGHSVSAVGRSGLETATSANYEEWSNCRVRSGGAVVPWGPVAGGNPLDVTKLGVRNLGANVAEWVADHYALYTDACWTPMSGQLLQDPRCDSPSMPQLAQQSIRGGSWGTAPPETRASNRNATVGRGGNPYIGVRCAVSMK